MSTKKIISFPVIVLLILFSCSKKENTLSENKEDTISNHIENNNADPTVGKTAISKNRFPVEGKKTADFIPESFELQYETQGDLNQDGLSDAALVIRKKEDSLGDRNVLILLRNPDKSYRLDKVSTTVFPLEYTEDHYKIYDTEDINIEKGELSIHLYSSGPTGNLFSNFKYVGENLFLTYIETYNMGAGSHQALYYEVLKGIFKQEIINTMKEEMPSETKTLHLKKERFLFENVSPEEVIQNAYKKIDGKLDY
jgi:hypothetical protein